MEDIYIANEMSERTDPWLTPMFVENKGEWKEFHEYIME